MVSTPRQRNLCNLDRSDRKPLLWRLVNRQYHLRRNRRCRPPRQGNEKERIGGNPIPAILLTPAIYHQVPNVSPIRFPPQPSTLVFHRSRRVRTVCTREECNHFRKYREIVEASFGKPTPFSKTRGTRGAFTVKESQDPGKDGVQREPGKLL